MADTAITTSNALTEDAFEADRRRIWGGFTKATRNAAIVVVIVLVLLYIFVV